MTAKCWAKAPWRDFRFLHVFNPPTPPTPTQRTISPQDGLQLWSSHLLNLLCAEKLLRTSRKWLMTRGFNEPSTSVLLVAASWLPRPPNRDLHPCSASFPRLQTSARPSRLCTAGFLSSTLSFVLSNASMRKKPHWRGKKKKQVFFRQTFSCSNATYFRSLGAWGAGAHLKKLCRPLSKKQ